MAKLKEAQSLVQEAMSGASSQWQYSIYSQFFQALVQQRDLYRTVQQQLTQRADSIDDVPDMMEQVVTGILP